MKRLVPLKLLVLGLLAACVTVNVYFPAAAAEQAADRIIDTVTSQPGGAKSKEPNETTPKKTPPNSRLTPKGAQPVLLVAAGALLNLLVPAAEAQASPNLDVSDPQIHHDSLTGYQSFRKRGP